MRVCAWPQPEGRWAIYAAWYERDEPEEGVWIATVAQAELGRRVQLLVDAEATARLRRSRRRTKGAGG